MKTYKTMSPPLIPQHAIDELNRQDALRAKRAKVLPKTSAALHEHIAQSVQSDLEMILKHGVCAETIMTPEGEVVVKTVAQVAAERFPVRSRWVRFKTPIHRFFRNFINATRTYIRNLRHIA